MNCETMKIGEVYNLRCCSTFSDYTEASEVIIRCKEILNQFGIESQIVCIFD